MIYLTYNNRDFTDGAGAQLQRILSIYMLSKYYNVAYIHSPLYKIDYQGLACLEKNQSDPTQIEKYNTLFTLPSDSCEEFDEIHDVTYIDEDTIINRYKFSSKNVLLKIAFAHKLVDQKQEILDVPIFFSWLETQLRLPCSIAVHVRRGELYVVDSDRMLPNSYYITCMKALEKILDEANISYEFHIYTENVSKEVIVTPHHHGVQGRIHHSVTLKPQDTCFDELACVKNLFFHVNTCPIETLQELSNSDILLASRSSYSYVAGILKKKGVVLQHPFWHVSKKSWIPVKKASNILTHKDTILTKIQSYNDA